MTIDGITPTKIERPATVEEAAEIVRAAASQGQRVCALGGGTHAEYGHPAERIDVCVDMRGLDQVVAYEPDDMTIGVQAGITAKTLATLLRARWQRLPLDVERPALATLGGMFAVGHSGPRSAFSGGLRDAAIGSRCILADGTVARSGGMVVKNATGYDLSRALAGSLGSLGIIAELNFKVASMPELARVLALRCDSFGVALEAAGRLYATRAPWTALLVTDDGIAYIGCEGRRADVAALAALARSSTDAPCTIAAAGARADAKWNALCGYAGAAADVVFKLIASPSAVGDAALAGVAAAAAHGYEARAQADVCAGSALLGVAGGGDAARLRSLEDALATVAERCIVVRAPRAQRAHLRVFGPPPAGLPLMRALKQRFDPRGVMNAGRNVGGI